MDPFSGRAEPGFIESRAFVLLEEIEEERELSGDALVSEATRIIHSEVCARFPRESGKYDWRKLDRIGNIVRDVAGRLGMLAKKKDTSKKVHFESSDDSESDDSSDSSEDESDNGGMSLPGTISDVKVVAECNQIKTNMSKFVYSRATLLSLIPDGMTDLLVRLGLGKVQKVFDENTSNRRFKRSWLKTGRPLPEKKIKFFRFPPKRDSYPFGGKPIKYIGRQIGTRVVVRRTGSYRSQLSFLKKEERTSVRLVRLEGSESLRKILIVKHEEQGVVVTPLGGSSYPKKVWLKMTPNPKHKKYWYFLRKNGRVYRSAHHPFDDEETTYESSMSL